MRTIEGLRWVPRWVSHLGCIEGCLRSLGAPLSTAWLYGGSGHAFVLNVVGDVCPSGPTDWDTRRFLELGRNLGYAVDGAEEYCPRGRGLAEAQRRAWDHVRRSIEAGIPCYGWELRVPEFYVVYGFDEVGYHVSGPECDEGEGPVPWTEPGTSEIGIVALRSVRLVPAADDAAVVRESLRYALALARPPRRWSGGNGGVKGYERWSRLLERGRAGDFGTRYNAAAWTECRRYAAAFLTEAGGRLDGRLRTLLAGAAAAYDDVHGHLAAVSEAYPFFTESDEEQVRADGRARDAAAHLRLAGAAETRGLERLEAIVAELGG